MNKISLEKALKLTTPALGNKNLIPGLDCFHFSGDRVTAFNGSIALSAPLGFTFPVSGAISGETFLKFVNGLDSEIELLSENPNSISIIYDNGSKTEFTVQAIDTTYLNDVEESGDKNLLPANMLFAAGLKRCMLSIGNNTGGEAGIYLFIENDECRMYSSNGYNASRFIFPIEGFVGRTEVYLPVVFCELLVFLYDQLNREPTEVCVTEKYIRASFGDVTLRSGFYSNPVNTELTTMVDECIAEVPLVEIPKAFKESMKRSEIITTKDSIVSISYGMENNSTVYVDAKGGKGGSESKLKDVISLPYPMEGSLNIDVRNIRKPIESCGQIGFNPNYIVIEGIEGYFDYMVSAKIGNN